MNVEGLTVTINAGKSDVPVVAKTPISILAREILQYAANIEQAIAIAKTREVFVAESIMVGSATDGRAILIEVSPNKFGVYEVQNTAQLVCSNHFQSEPYKNDKNNNETILNSHSQYRYERMQELLSENEKVNPVKAAAILRNRDGLDGLSLGYGNEKAINQLLAHHAVIFKPEQKLAWVSANPYQLGEFVAYDLNEVFGQRTRHSIASVQKEELNIPEDPFVRSAAFRNYEEFRIQDRIIDRAIQENEDLPQDFVNNYQSLNPDFWKVYYSVGQYYFNRGFYAAAGIEFNKALTKEITTLPARQSVEEYLKKIKSKLD